MIKLNYPAGSTPLDPDEMTALKPGHITTQHQLNEWEAKNILEAEHWLFAKPHKNFLTPEFARKLHQKMFEHTWKWAGIFRNSEKTIGVAPYNISTDLTNLLDDVRAQITNLKAQSDEERNKEIDEIAVRFHHRLVAIHPFPNGNGRHARLMTDFLLIQAGRPRFSWGKTNLTEEGEARTLYIRALKLADAHDYAALNAFVRS